MDWQLHAAPVAASPPEAIKALACPFPVREHPARQRLQRATQEWLAVFPEGECLSAHRYDEVHAQMWPDAPWERLWLANRLLLHMWWIDDILDDPLRSDVTAIATTHRDVLVKRSTGRDTGSRMLAELLDEVAGLMPESWNSRVRQLYLAYLETSLLHRDHMAVVPTLEEYFRLRPLMGGMFYAIALSELAYDCPLPRRLYKGGWMSDLTLRVNRVCCWVNDLYAYVRETSKGDSFNLVAILHRHHGFTLQEAMENVTRLIESELTVLSLLAISDANSRTERYLQGLKDMVAAILTWSAHTLRYA